MEIILVSVENFLDGKSNVYSDGRYLTIRTLSMLLTQPTVFGSALSISDPSVLTSLTRKRRRTEF